VRAFAHGERRTAGRVGVGSRCGLGSAPLAFARSVCIFVVV